jgi:hypothetical protein
VTELDDIADSTVGVFAWMRADGSSTSCAVTPFVVDDRVVVTSTLAYTAKAAAVRRDPRVAVLAGGRLVSGRAEVFVDESPEWFDRNIRDVEARKFPPTRSILSIPGHRRLFPWYVGRIVIAFRPDHAEPVPGDDRVTATWPTADGIRIEPLTATPDELSGAATVTEGPIHILFHEEHDRMKDLRQLAIRGTVSAGRFVEESRRGSLDAGRATAWAQLRELRTLTRAARRNRERIRAWTPVSR